MERDQEQQKVDVEVLDGVKPTEDKFRPVTQMLEVTGEAKTVLERLPPFDYSVYSNPEFDGLPVLGPNLYAQNSGTYLGQYKDGLRCGRGKFTSTDGTIYEGYWENDQAHHFGRKILEDGAHYEGQWKFGEYHGDGKYVFSDGRSYQGSWAVGKQHGKGTFINSAGEVRIGEWDKGTRTSWIS